MKSRQEFRILKQKAEAAQACLNDDTHLCMLLIAAKVLEARKQLNLLKSMAPTTLASSTDSAATFVAAINKLTNDVCPREIQHDGTPTTSAANFQAASNHLSKIPNAVWQDDFAIGYAYQFLSMASRKKAQANIQRSNKELSQADLIAFTQLYTPDWVVHFLVANCIIPLLSEAAGGTSPTTPLPEYAAWALTNKVNGSLSPKEISVIDPACGAGNFLVCAFDLLVKLHISAGLSPHESVCIAQTANIHGSDLDRDALWFSALALLIKSFQYSEKPPAGIFNLDIASGVDGKKSSADNENLLGSLDRQFPPGHALAKKHSVALMNPPYIGRKLMSRALKAALKKDYGNSHSDISAAFIERGLELLEEGGRLGAITQASILTLPSYGRLRQELLNKFNLIACVDAGSGVFPLQGGDKVNSAILVIENLSSSSGSYFFDLRSDKNKGEALTKEIESLRNSAPGRYFRHDQKTFLQEHESAIKYGCPRLILCLVRELPTLGDFADIRQGLATSDNERFLRKVDDVPPEQIGTLWFPYMKGAGSDRWFSPIAHVVNWADNGKEIKQAVNEAYPYLKGNTKWVVKNEQFYFRPGLCFSFVNTGNLAVRKLPAGCIFDVGASAVFAHNSDDENFLLAYLNSSLIAAIAKSINPTVNFQVGDIKRLPMFPFNKAEKDEMSEIARSCCAIAEKLHEMRSHSAPMLALTRKVKTAAAAQAGPAAAAAASIYALMNTLAELERRNDAIVLQALVENFSPSPEQQEEITKWISS